MAHCHIAEHHESGMMFSLNVTPALPGIDIEQLRWPSALTFIGVLLSMVSGLLHPGTAIPNNHAAAFVEYAASAHWTHIHLGQFAGMALVIAGILALLLPRGRPAKSMADV